MKRGEAADLCRVRAIADYQFGPGAGEALFPDGVQFLHSNTGRVRQVLDSVREDSTPPQSDSQSSLTARRAETRFVRIATVRARDGRLTLSMAGGRRLHARFPPPRWRVTVSDEAAPFVADGGNAFAKHVAGSDPDIRALDEVLVVDPEDRLVAVGQARLGSAEMGLLKRGVAVEVRDHAAIRKSPL